MSACFKLPSCSDKQFCCSVVKFQYIPTYLLISNKATISERSTMILNNVVAFLCLIGFTLAFDCITKTQERIQPNQICNGIIDCVDKSDEMFELCYNRTCADQQFRCTYGGCLAIEKKCDSIIDCWDESDENKLLCQDDDEMSTFYDEKEGDCVEQFSCNEKEQVQQCLYWSQVCDGQLDCSNGSDEDKTLCSIVDCPPPAFRCLYGGCISGAAVCNHIPDCYDASDERPGICDPQMASHSTESRVTSGQPQPAPTTRWEVKHCKLEDQSGYLIAETYVGNYTYRSNSTVRDGTVVNLRCTNGHGLIGEQQNICECEKWRYELAKCVPQCQYTGNILHRTQCTRHDRLIDCDQSVLPMETRMVVTCASGYEANEKPGVQVCHGNDHWIVEEELPKCQPICGVWKFKDQDEEKNPPWMVSIFQRGREPEFEYRCMATILSHYVLITSEKCFRNKTIKGAHSTEAVLYTVAEGKAYTDRFWAGEDHCYKLHNVSTIHIIRKDEASFHPLALVHLIQPLEFSWRVRPICLPSVMTQEWETRGNFSDMPLGQAIAKVDASNRYELREVLASKTLMYDINAIMEPIQNDIAECQENGNI